MAVKEEVLNIPEKLSDQFLYADAVKSLVEQKKKEAADLNHSIFLANTQLMKLQSDQAKEKMMFDQKLRADKTKADNEFNKKSNDFAHREQKLSQGEQNLNDRLAMIRQKEEQMAKFEEEKKAIYNERIEIEKFKNASQIEFTKTQALKQEAQSKIDNAAVKEAQALAMFQKAKDMEASSEQKLGNAIAREKEAIATKENIEKIRDEITPKLEELETKRSEIEKNLKLIKQKEDEIKSKIEQDKIMLSNISNRESVVRTKEIDIASREEEVMRKEMLNKK